MEGRSKGQVQSDIFKAAVEGDIKVLDWEGQLLASFKTPDVGNTIVHIAVRHRQLEVVNKAVSLFPDLLRQKNNYDNTPLHEAAQWGTKETVQLLISLHQSSTASSSSSGSATPVPCLFEVNHDGDTPFHLALRIGNLAAAEELFLYVKDHPEILLMKTNLHKETPLHLYVRYCPDELFPPMMLIRKITNFPEQTLIYQLIEANISAIFEHDSEGLNPLIKASQYGRVFILRMLLKYRHSIECRDSKGRGILHHLRLLTNLNERDKEYTLYMCRKILKVPGLDILIISQDQDGNTPLHLAILEKEFDLAQLILEQYVQAHLGAQKYKKGALELIVSIKNTDGKTVFDLVTSEPGIPQILKNLMEQAGRGRLMDEQLYKATERLDMPDGDDSALLCQDVVGKNILHIATEKYRHDDRDDKHTKFIREAITKCPKLMYQKNWNDDTPLHLAARLLDNKAAIVLLEECLKCWYSRRKDDDIWLDLEMPPWKVKNSRGDTPLHEAVRASNREFLNKMSKNLFDKDLNEALSDVNEYRETALHLVARYIRNVTMPDLISSDDNLYLRKFRKANKTAVYMRDLDGFTPILRAAHCGQPHIVDVMSHRNRPSVYMRDYKGRNVFHHLCTTGFSDVLYNDFVIYRINGETYSCDHMILSKDDDGNTPLHLAIMHQNIEAAEILTGDRFVEHKSSAGIRRFTEIKNNDGKSIMDLITCAVGIPSNLKELIIEHSHVPIMDDNLYEAAKKADTHVMFERDLGINQRKKWYRQARDGSTVLHIALRHHNKPFVKNVVSFSYEFIYLKDSKGDTPLHFAVGLPTDEALAFLNMCCHRWRESFQNNFPPPWKVGNSKGNTYLHEAARLCNCKYKVIFSELLKDIGDLKNVMNDHGETLLHVTARYATYAAKEFLEECRFEQIMPLVYIRDFEGFTPVVRAAQYGRLGMARLLIQKCPESVEIRDNKGRTFLHYMRALVADLVDDLRDSLPVWKDFFKQPGVDDLRSAQDEDGNTPLHLAIIDANFTEAKFLMEICLLSEYRGELYMENNYRNTILGLLSNKSRSNMPAVGELKQLLSRINIVERQLKYTMDEELYQAAKQGNAQYVENATTPSPTLTDDIEIGPTTRIQTDFQSQTADGSNIIHISLKYGNSNNAVEFVEAVLRCFPKLSMRPDINGDTPLHLAAKWKAGQTLVKSLTEAANKYLSNLDDEGKKAYEVPPWAVKNYRGNFPIHEALQSGNLKTALELLRCDDEGASLVNDSGETPLHAFANNGFPVSVDEVNEFVEELMKKGNLATFGAYTQDIEGRTPLISAAKCGRLLVVKAILKHHPQSAYFRDPNGRTFLHVLRFTGEDVDETSVVETEKELWENPAVDAQRMVQDNDGNTPLHCAIKNGNAAVAMLLTQRCLDCQKTQNLAELSLMNKEGETIPYLIASHGDVPSEVIELMQKKAPEAVRMNRSSYGINKIEMKESANALSVVAALLATITFAAAFQVPGGFGDDGFPILLQKPAFAIFSLANTIAMCSSMLCLFLLLWVMGIGKIQESLKILDASIFLLRLSFYLTLVTFTTGMFVVTVEKSLWLAILICVFSFLTFLLTQRSILLIISKHGRSAFKGIKTKFVKSICGN